MKRIVIDTALGVPVELRDTRDGVLRIRITIGYQRDPDGTAVRNAVRTERFDHEKSGGRFVSEWQLSGVHFEKRN